jgi:two-component system cell cycle sensor histidine kinase/response regulator CckA
MTQSKSYKVLVVEDEGLIAHDIASRLEALGHEVVGTADTAAEAIEKAPGADIVLMDIRIDGPSDGIDAAAEIRRRFHIPVVFLTGQTDRATLERAKHAEPFGYIVKPLAPHSLQTSIEIAVHKHGADRQIEEREAWLRTTLASVADAVIVTDVRSRVVSLNRVAEVLTGWIQPEAEGQHLSRIVRLLEKSSDHDADDPVPLALLRDSAIAIDGWTLVSRSGREILVDGSVAPVKAPGRMLGAAITLRDVSVKRWEERQLRQSQKLETVARLAAGISNDYATLLAIIRSRADRLQGHLPEFSPARQAAEEIQEAAAAAEQLTRRLNSLGTRQVSHPEIVNLNALIRRSTSLIESVAGSQIEVILRPQLTAGRVRADVHQIEQAVMSMVIHSCARMTQGGRLLIETGETEIQLSGRAVNYVLLAITHTGAEPNLDGLFEPLTAAEEEIALSTVHAVISEHGGYLSARATPGGGCRFELLLPRWTSPTLLPRPEGQEAASILLVEPRENVREQLHNFFEAQGFNLLEAADAVEALALAGMREGTLRVLIAETQEADAIAGELRRSQPSLSVLRITEDSAGPGEIARPFTQQELLAQVEAILKSVPRIESATAAKT